MPTLKITEDKSGTTRDHLMQRLTNHGRIKLLAPVLAAILLMYSCTLTTKSGKRNNYTNEYPTWLYSESDPGPVETKNEGSAPAPRAEREEVRAVWITYGELAVKDPGCTAQQYTEKISGMMDNLAASGINTACVHVRAFGDAFYRSSYFPWSAYLSGTQGVAPQYDPLEIAVEQAHSRGIEVHAWVNPYRVSSGTDVAALAPENPARKWIEAGGNTNTIVIDSGIYYNPASSEVQKLIISGIREILENYDVDGIHFDDYFYPSPDESIDAADYRNYLDGGGKLELSAWRRANVNALVSSIYSAVKESGEDRRFGVSTSADISRNMNSLYADVVTWASQDGYVDYLCPQIYFGFDHPKLPFGETLDRWGELVTNDNVELYTGLAVYKCGAEDVNAGAETASRDNARYEWLNNSDMISRQIKCCRENEKNSGIAFFSYSYLFNGDPSPILRQETESALTLLK